MTDQNMNKNAADGQTESGVHTHRFKPLGGRGRRVLLALIDAAWLCLVFLLVLFFASRSADGMVFGNSFSIRVYWRCLLVILACVMAGRILTHAYDNIWRYPNVTAYMTMLVSDTVSGMIAYVINRNLHEKVKGIHIGFWQTFCVMALFALGTLAMRFAYQLIHARRNENGGRMFRPTKESENKINVAIIGAGDSGKTLAEQLMRNSYSHYRPYCFVDTDPSKVNAKLCGIRVYDEKDDIINRLKSMPVQEIFIALPKLGAQDLSAMCARYSETGCKVKVCSEPREPGLIRNLTESDYVSLLGRDPLKVNDDETRAFYRGKTVLVTGGGGSIGSEICRQIAKCHPKKLIVFDIQEEGVYKLCIELRKKYANANEDDKFELIDEIGSVRDVQRLDATFSHYRPDVVFHAAAHKHVPLMECNDSEAIKNNVIGTYNTANAAEKYGVSRFVLISTDKAVNPTNIMGASKQMCEHVVLCRRDSATVFTAVRFGNVLGSSGSVIPLFQRQIAEGGPVTVTDKEIVRYFMTIPEASQLVMQAGAKAKSGELFVLNMGQEVKIWSLAEKLIYMSGYRPGVNMEIVEIGRRPGEKLYEELLINNGTCEKTDNSLIYIETAPQPTRAEVDNELDILREALVNSADEVHSPLIREALKKVVTTFKEPNEVNEKAAEAREMKEVRQLDLGISPCDSGSSESKKTGKWWQRRKKQNR